MRLIDADKVIEVIKRMQKAYPIKDQRPHAKGMRLALFDCKNLIENQPTVYAWIPVSERLPEYDEVVLLKIKDGEDYWYDNFVTGKRRKADKIVQQREEYITTGMTVHELDDVIAWKPIEPYKESTNETN